MFEREAKAYKEIVMKEHLQNPFPRSVEDVWQDGATFGYNKANEWHFVKDGDLPKKTDEYLVYRMSGYGCESIELIQYNSSRHFWCVDCQNEIIAWKEIVFPELKESE